MASWSMPLLRVCLGSARLYQPLLTVTDALVASRSGFDPVFLSETIRAKLEEWPGVGRVWVAQEEQPVSSGQATTVRTSAVRAVALAIEPGGSLDVRCVTSVGVRHGASQLIARRRAIPADISLSIKQWQQDVVRAHQLSDSVESSPADMNC